MNIYQEKLYEAIENVFKEKARELKFDYTITGKILSYDSVKDLYTVLYDGSEIQVKARVGLALEVGDIVCIRIIRGDFNNKFIDYNKNMTELDVGGVGGGTTALGNLLVDNLSTSDKIRNYLASNTAQVNYIRIFDQLIEFVEATYSGGTTQARTGDKTGDLLYWTDNTHNFVTSVTDGSLEAVTVYNYTELIKGKFGFEFDGVNNTPKLILGIGDGVNGKSAQAEIYKGTTGLEINYYMSNTGEKRQILIDDNEIKITGNTGDTGLRNIGVGDVLPTTGENNELFILKGV